MIKTVKKENTWKKVEKKIKTVKKQPKKEVKIVNKIKIIKVEYVFMQNVKHNWINYEEWQKLQIENAGFDILKKFCKKIEG